MRQILNTATLIALAAVLTGCIQSKDEYTLNPDGSGKVVHEATLQAGMNIDLGNASGNKPDPAAQLTNAVLQELEKAIGVDTWKDISFTNVAGGTRFKATAYFKDLSKIKFYNGGFKAEFLVPTLRGDKQGGLTLELSNVNAKQMTPPGAPPASTTTNESDRMTEERAKFQQMKPMLAVMLATLRMEQKFHLPGSVQEAKNLKSESPDTVSITMDGKKMLDAIEALTSDDNWMRQNLLANNNPGRDSLVQLMMNEKLFGERAVVEAKLAATGKPLAPLFDYATEAAAARKAFPALLKAGGLTTTAAAVNLAPATAGASFKSLTVGGVRLIRVVDAKRGIRPFNYDTGYTLSLVGELPGSVLEITAGNLESATADTGEDLLLTREWDRRIHSTTLSSDGAAVVFEIKMAVPGPNVKGIKELTGSLEYLVSDSTKKVDLGIETFTVNTTGKELGAKIARIGEGSFKKGQEMSISLNVSHSMVKSVTFYGPDGAVLPTSSSGWSGGSRNVTLMYSTDGKFPDTGRIVVEVFENLQKYKLPFKLSNISLIGTPLP